ncbi:2Fe-2S iron-sulfur cluster-binding protein [Vibrio olivae]
MSQLNRLAAEGRIDRSRPVSFEFNGQHYQGFEGDTLASALIANGVDIIGRSFKYGRPRGIVGSGAEEPNAIMQLGATEATQVPNVRATQQELYNGLVSKSTNGWPNVERFNGICRENRWQHDAPRLLLQDFYVPQIDVGNLRNVYS